MGTDIHIVIERRWDGRWVGVQSDRVVATASYTEDDTSSRWVDFAVGRRSYAFFGRLANVRTPGPDPLGLPPDGSDLTRMLVAMHGLDGHSHSHLPLHDFAVRWCADDAEFMAALTKERLLGESTLYSRLLTRASMGRWDADDDPADFRVVFWFDN